MIHPVNNFLVNQGANQISVPQESFWGKHKVKVVVVGCIVTAVALAVLFWPASFGCVGALAVTYGISLATVPLGLKSAMFITTGLLYTVMMTCCREQRGQNAKSIESACLILKEAGLGTLANRQAMIKKAENASFVAVVLKVLSESHSNLVTQGNFDSLIASEENALPVAVALKVLSEAQSNLVTQGNFDALIASEGNADGLAKAFKILNNAHLLIEKNVDLLLANVGFSLDFSSIFARLDLFSFLEQEYVQTLLANPLACEDFESLSLCEGRTGSAGIIKNFLDSLVENRDKVQEIPFTAISEYGGFSSIKGSVSSVEELVLDVLEILEIHSNLNLNI